MAGRPRKPSNVLALKGAFKHNPDRGAARANEPVPVGEIGDPPAHLTEHQAECWREVVDLAHLGTLSKNDRLIVEHLAMVLAHLRENRWLVDPAWLIRFERCLNELGMTPAARSKVSVIKPKENANPFGKFAAH